jgi:hypothetical protein
MRGLLVVRVCQKTRGRTTAALRAHVATLAQTTTAAQREPATAPAVGTKVERCRSGAVVVRAVLVIGTVPSSCRPRMVNLGDL